MRMWDPNPEKGSCLLECVVVTMRFVGMIGMKGEVVEVGVALVVPPLAW